MRHQEPMVQTVQKQFIDKSQKLRTIKVSFLFCNCFRVLCVRSGINPTDGEARMLAVALSTQQEDTCTFQNAQPSQTKSAWPDNKGEGCGERNYSDKLKLRNKGPKEVS